MTGDPTGGRVLVVVPSEWVQPSGGEPGVQEEREPTHGDGESTQGERGSTTGTGGTDSDASNVDDFCRGGSSAPKPSERTHPQERSDESSDRRYADESDYQRHTDENGDRRHTGRGSADSDGPLRDSCDPSRVISELEERLSVDVVMRCTETAIEYVEELGPTLECVVVLVDDRQLLHALVAAGSVPTIVCQPPIVGRIDEGATEADSIETLIEYVQAEIQRECVENDLQESNARLTALSHYAEDITACETVEAVVERTVEATIDALAFDYCVVLLAEDTLLVPRASTLPDPPASPCGVSEGIAGRTLARGKSEIVPDMQTDPDAIPEHDELHAVLSVPIADHGVIQVVSSDYDAFDDRDREFVEILAGYTREALERIGREVTLRRERDRLHAFFSDFPSPAIYVERRGGVTVVEEANHAYSEHFGGLEPGQQLADVVQTDAEFEQYQHAFDTGTVSTGSAERTTTNGGTETFALRIIPVSRPTVHECAYGIYVGDRTTKAFESVQ
ncbi:GAF domain-containing protein [Halobellus captivus]|uniref:GAF domain-containing protein n=1 Tax=Halobellus captivus TaxID=2592614 RepID=UPI0011A24702|nr:GAF domain-containing protein [Halobellus captivus]